ncbi:MAG: efflux RND transporter periplasmic adaptor subunit [Armatimonadota bacterium]
MRTKRKLLAAGILVALLVIGIAIAKSRKGTEKPETATARVTRGAITASVSGSGVLKPLTMVEVKSNVGGQIVKLAVDEGDLVRAGQLIARIDPSDTMTALKQAQADYDSALAKVRQARQQARVQPELTSNSIGQAESSLASAEAALHQTKTATVPQKLSSAQSSYNQAKATYDQSEKNLARQQALFAQGFVPKSQIETAEEQYEVAKAQLATARSKYETIKSETDQDMAVAEAKVRETRASLKTARANSYQVGAREDDIVQAKAQLERARAAMENARTRLGYTDIYAPRSGVVVKKYVEEGSIITAGLSSFSGSGSGVTIVDIADTNRMLVQVDVDEADIAQVQVGQPVKIAIDAYPNDRVMGVVTKIAPQATMEQNVTTIPVTVEISHPSGRFKPEMNATCDFIVARRDDTLLVPSKAVKETPNGTIVMVMDGEKLIPRPVTTGLSDDDNTEILSGLREGETVAVEDNKLPMNGGARGGMRGGPPPF